MSPVNHGSLGGAPAEVAQLADRLALGDLMARFATGLDSCDWTMYRSVFTDEIALDYSSWRPESLGRWSADDWTSRAARSLPGLTATRHALSTLVVDLNDGGDPDAARVRAAVCADHVLQVGDQIEVFTLNGAYDDRCRRTEQGWKIEKKCLIVQWTVGDRSVLDRAAVRVAQRSPEMRSGR